MEWNFFKDRKFFLLILAVIILFFLSIFFGDYGSSFNSWSSMFKGENELLKKIVLNHRLPRSLAVVFTGIALPISGWVLQEYFRNPLAGPSILGVTSSASLGAAVVIMLGSSLGISFMGYKSEAIIFGAILGTALSMLILWSISNRLNATSYLIIIGFMIATLAGALIAILEFFASSEDLKSYVLWGFGSLSGLTITQLIYFFISLLLGLFVVKRNINHLIKMQLGNQYAQTMGVNVKKVRVELILSATLLTGVCTALVGPIAFIGLAIPHLCRIYLKTANFNKLFVYIILTGILFMLFFSIVANHFPWGTLPINIITALFGAPIVIYIVFKNRNQFYE